MRLRQSTPVPTNGAAAQNRAADVSGIFGKCRVIV
jgi:hypothetical protein